MTGDFCPPSADNVKTMKGIIMRNVITIPKGLTQGAELIVVSRQEYVGLKKRLAELQDALAKIRQGEEELASGRTQVVDSLTELLSK